MDEAPMHSRLAPAPARLAVDDVTVLAVRKVRLEGAGPRLVLVVDRDETDVTCKVSH